MTNTRPRRPAIRCSPTGYSSARYGACEVCATHVSDVFIGTADDGYTHVFGHERCVRSIVGLEPDVATIRALPGGGWVVTGKVAGKTRRIRTMTEEAAYGVKDDLDAGTYGVIP